MKIKNSNLKNMSNSSKNLIKDFTINKHSASLITLLKNKKNA